MMQFDYELTRQEIQELSNADAISAFFSKLGYATDKRTPQDPGNLGITADGTLRPIKKVELIANYEGFLQVYLFELSSVTIAHTKSLCRSFRNRVGNFILVLTTSDYERLDFVLIEKLLPITKAKSITQVQIGVRPRPLTIDRKKPETVHLRVLRRFTFTESDPFAQYDKLLNAYAIADWSEEYFNNRALFSDHYLMERLRERDEWKEDPKPAYQRLKELYFSASSKYGNKPEEFLRSNLYENVFKILSFDYIASKKADSSTKEPDYFLYKLKTKSNPIAVCLTYAWGRSLDSKDETRDQETSEENPGAVVVSLLEKELAPWAIVTNGRIWRLYSQKTHSRATNYYEIDLEEILAQGGGPLANDPAEAFRFFWLLFRSQAFIPETITREGKEQTLCFLDQLLSESEDYAKNLGERLKDRVFERVFPHLAEGFITYIRQQKGTQTELPQEELDRIFTGTLMFLYRMLFLLYAEARDLLPVKEIRGYYEASLTRIKKEIASVAGQIEDEVDAKLKKNYRDDESDIYDRLNRLFEVIDLGETLLNVPVYNGGLFITNPDKSDPSDDAQSACFLKTTKITNRHLARAIDLLARDIDTKRQDLVFIDYKSLGVRQLGSIYEGLLEFKLRIAPEKMAIIQGKKTEEVIPYKEAEKDKKILMDGRGKDAKERILPKGAVYLENDKRERKATGSYYTPDYIVDYIVEHTVGPVLEKRFEELRPKLRQAAKECKEFDKQQEVFKQKGMKPKLESQRELIGKELVKEIFDIKVLDPAMGSGHFLVEAVDYITDKIIDFLNAFPSNPVSVHLNQMRETILSEMDEQGITIDRGRLTDVNLLKRHVLKRCIYGVDINPMAVELAKVSLWLDCFTLGAPLSFLDHHMRCGNSLVGATVEAVRNAIQAKGQTSLLFAQDRFAGLMRATDWMRHVGELSDVTTSQVQESRKEYKKASDALLPYNRTLDIYTSRWFGNTPIKSVTQRKHKGYVQITEERDVTVEMICSSDIDALLKVESHQIPSEINKLTQKDDKQILSTAFEAHNKYRFFHWELEFPEVFYEDGSEKRNPGFDAVIGNPPYVRQEGLDEFKVFFSECKKRVYQGTADIYVYFYEQGINVCRNGGYFGMITSNKYLRANYGKLLRDYLRNYKIERIIDFHDLPIFPDAIAYPLICIINKEGSNSIYDLITLPIKSMSDARNLKDINTSLYTASSGVLNKDSWDLCDPQIFKIIENINNNGIPLYKLINDKFYRGIVTGYNDAFIITEEIKNELIKDDKNSGEIIKPFLRGRDVNKWNVDWDGLYLIFTRKGVDIDAYPAVKEYLLQWKDRLIPKQEKNQKGLGRKPGSYKWYEIQDSIAYYEEFEKSKIIYPNIFKDAIFAYDDKGFYSNQKTFIIPTKRIYLLAILNSSLINFWCKHSLVKLQHGYFEPNAVYFKNCPIVNVDKTIENTLKALSERAKNVEGRKDVENKINEIIYNQYHLTEREISIIQGDLGEK